MAAVVATFTAAAANDSPTTPEARWNAVVACAARPDERTRHACVDDVLRKAGALTVAQDERDQRQGFGRTTAAPTQAVEPAEIDLAIASVSEGRDGRLMLTTADGAVWRQIESRVFAQTPSAGQTLTIRKAALGSFLCTVNGRSPFRCSRSR